MLKLTPTQLTVILAVSTSGILFVVLIALYFKLRVLKKKNVNRENEYSYLRDRILIYPTSELERPNKNRLYTVFARQRSMSESNVHNPAYLPMAVGLGRSDFLQVPPFSNSTSGSETSLAPSATSSRSDNSDPHSNGEGGETAAEDTDRNQSPTDVELPMLEFRLNYFSSTESLHVTVVQVRNIPAQFRKSCSTYVKLSLKAFNRLKTKRFKTKTVRHSLNPIFDEEVVFSPYTFDELRNYRIRFSAYCRSGKISKRTLVGDVFVPLARPDFERDCLLGVVERFSPACPQTGKRGVQLVAGELGFLQVELSFAKESHRLKIFVRKGQGLKSNSIGIAEFYVICTLMKNGEAIATKETRPALGQNPTFNQAFLFYLNEADIGDYGCQLLLMKGQVMAKDGAVGHVVLGQNAGLQGKAHWDQATTTGDVTKWHQIYPVKTHCLG